MKHLISGKSFHGNYEVTLNGNQQGFELSKRQIIKYKRALCPYAASCKCGGRIEPDSFSAEIIEFAPDRFKLIPATD